MALSSLRQTSYDWAVEPRYLGTGIFTCRRRPVEESDLEESCDDAHIQVVIDDLPPELNSNQRTAAKKFIRDRAGLFSKSDYDMGERTWFNK